MATRTRAPANPVEGDTLVADAPADDTVAADTTADEILAGTSLDGITTTGTLPTGSTEGNGPTTVAVIGDDTLTAEMAPTMSDMQAMTDDILSDPAKLEDYLAENPLPEMGELPKGDLSEGPLPVAYPVLGLREMTLPTDRAFSILLLGMQGYDDFSVGHIAGLAQKKDDGELDLSTVRVFKVAGVIHTPYFRDAIQQSARTDRWSEPQALLEERLFRVETRRAVEEADGYTVMHFEAGEVILG